MSLPGSGVNLSRLITRSDDGYFKTEANLKLMTEPLSRPTETAREDVPWLSWLVRAALVVLAISIAAAHAPIRVKLLGLFSIGAGGAMGAASAFFTKPHPDRVPRRWLAILFLMAFSGLAGSTWLAFRSEAASQAKSPQQQMAATMMKQMERDSNGEIVPATSISAVDEFRWYLTRRVKQLGSWPSPWPELFWIAELLAGGVAAAWGFRFGVASSRKAAASEEASR